MNIDTLGRIFLIVVLTLLSGWGDSQGFLHASNIWLGGKLVWSEFIKSALGFSLGLGMYWICIRFLQEFRIVSPEMQTLGWFTVTIVGVALFSGKFLQWHFIDQIVGIAILLGIGWLLYRTAG